jgi:hypothetical protein
MNPDAGQEARGMVSNDPITVRVDHNARGSKVTLPNESRRVTCETFDDDTASHTCAPLTPAPAS